MVSSTAIILTLVKWVEPGARKSFLVRRTLILKSKLRNRLQELQVGGSIAPIQFVSCARIALLISLGYTLDSRPRAMIKPH